MANSSCSNVLRLSVICRLQASIVTSLVFIHFQLYPSVSVVLCCLLVVPVLVITSISWAQQSDPLNPRSLQQCTRRPVKAQAWSIVKSLSLCLCLVSLPQGVCRFRCYLLASLRRVLDLGVVLPSLSHSRQQRFRLLTITQGLVGSLLVSACSRLVYC